MEGSLLPTPRLPAEVYHVLTAHHRARAVSRASGTIGADDDAFRTLVVAALKSKKMSRDDFNRAVEAQTGQKATPEKKQAVGEKLLAFCAKRNIKVSS